MFAGELKRHSLKHSNERPYLCTQCPKSFTRPQYLKEHLNNHSGARPYKCSFCPSAFSDANSYYRHLRTHGHINRNVKFSATEHNYVMPGTAGSEVTQEELEAKELDIKEMVKQKKTYGVVEWGSVSALVQVLQNPVSRASSKPDPEAAQTIILTNDETAAHVQQELSTVQEVTAEEKVEATSQGGDTMLAVGNTGLGVLQHQQQGEDLQQLPGAENESPIIVQQQQHLLGSVSTTVDVEQVQLVDTVREIAQDNAGIVGGEQEAGEGETVEMTLQEAIERGYFQISSDQNQHIVIDVNNSVCEGIPQDVHLPQSNYASDNSVTLLTADESQSHQMEEVSENLTITGQTVMEHSEDHGPSAHVTPQDVQYEPLTSFQEMDGSHACTVSGENILSLATASISAPSLNTKPEDGNECTVDECEDFVELPPTEVGEPSGPVCMVVFTDSDGAQQQLYTDAPDTAYSHSV